MSTPTVKSALIAPSRSSSTITGASVSSPVSCATSRRTPSALPARHTVMAMRTAAASRVSLVQGWSGTAMTIDTGVLAERWRCITRRWNTWLIELVVTKPKRRSAVPLRVSSSAARSHQCMTKSALSFMAGLAAQSASA